MEKHSVKQIMVYLVALILACFAIPTLFASQFKVQSVNSEEKPESPLTSSSYDYHNYNTIRLFHVKTNTIEQQKLDDYLYGVVASEMPADFQIEALKAQAVVARTYTIYKIQHNNEKHPGADICDDSTCCQAWISKEDRLAKWEESQRESNWNKIVEAVNSTQGKIITYQKEPINAFFHSNSGGSTEVPVNVWGGNNYPYLQTVQTAGEEGYRQYASEVALSKEELINKVKEKHADFSIDWNDPEALKITEYTESNRVKIIKIGNLNIAGVEARSLFGLKSTNFEVSIEGEQIIFRVKGYGHGVGMSQTGADSMAKNRK